MARAHGILVVLSTEHSVARLLVLARPRGAWLVACLPLLGAGYALWERGSTVSPFVVAPTLGFLAASWICTHVGAMWLNAALDRDDGAVLFGRSVEPPPYVSLAGYGALLCSVALAWPLGVWPMACSLACAGLAVLYSHPRVALKGRPIGGPLVNGAGYGALSPLAGWASIDPVLPTWRAALALVLGIVWILGLYFAAQAFQGEEDRRRGYRTFVVTHGPLPTLRVSQTLLRTAAIVAMASALAGIYPRTVLVSVPLFWWADRGVSAWMRAPSDDARAASQLVRRLSIATVVCIAAVYAHHFAQLARDEPGGGCATAIVPDVLASVCAR